MMDSESETSQSDSDSGGSLYIPHSYVSEAVLTTEPEPRYNQLRSSSLRNRNDSHARPSIASPGKSSPGKSSPEESSPEESSPGESSPGKSLPEESSPGKSSPWKSLPGKSSPWKSLPEESSPEERSPEERSPEERSPVRKRTKKVKLPRYSFPYFKEKSTTKRFTNLKNAKLHYALMGGFLINVRELQASVNRGEDHLQASLPTIDEDGLCLSPISENEDGPIEEASIRVVKKSCFVVSSKKRGEKHQRSVWSKKQTDAPCSNDDAAVCESNPNENPENNGSVSAAAADPELLLPIGEAESQTLHNNGTNYDTGCHESGIMEKRKREEHKSREEEQEEENACNLTIRDEMSFAKDEMHTAPPKHKKKKRIKNCHEAEEVMQEANENGHGQSGTRAVEDLEICVKRKRDITASEETEQVQDDTAFNPPNEDAQVSEKKKKRSKIIKPSLEPMDETSTCLEDAASPQKTPEKPESVSKHDPAGEVSDNTYSSLHISTKKKKKKRSAQIVDVLLNQEEEEEGEELPQKPAEGADSADLVTRKRKKKKKSRAFSSVSICCETVAGTEDSECVTTSSPPADAEEKASSDPTSAEITTSTQYSGKRRRRRRK